MPAFPQLKWSPSARVAMALRNLALCGWFGGLILLAVIATGHWTGSLTWLVMLNLFAIFPVYGLGVVLMSTRVPKAAGIPRHWISLAFRGLPPTFYHCFQSYFILVWIISAYPLLRLVLKANSWPGFGLSPGIGFVLVPTAFHLIAAGIFWSVAKSRNWVAMNPPQLPRVSP